MHIFGDCGARVSMPSMRRIAVIYLHEFTMVFMEASIQ